jgi:hypothetical protein
LKDVVEKNEIPFNSTLARWTKNKMYVEEKEGEDEDDSIVTWSGRFAERWTKQL